MESEVSPEYLRLAVRALRAPLNGILGSVEMLRMGPLDPQQAASVRTLAAHCDVLLRLLDDVSDLVRLEGSRLALDRERVLLLPVVEQALADATSKAEERGIALILERLPAASQAVLGDPARVRQLIANLIFEALDVSGGASVMLEVSDEAGAVRVAVCGSAKRAADVPHPARELRRAVTKGLAAAMGGDSGCDRRGLGARVFWCKLPAVC